MNERIKSAEAFEEAKQIIPGGVDSPVRALKSVGTTPLFVRRAEGPYIFDIDDNRFIDFCMSWGVFILGHNNERVDQAAIHAISNGSSFGIPTLSETTLAKKVREAFPSMERLRFVNSGTEATMSAIRVARGFTGRDILVKFEGCYHGHAASAHGHTGKPSVFFPHSNLTPDVIPPYLSDLGYEVRSVVVYNNKMPSQPQRVNLQHFKRIVFTSPSTIDNFIKLYGQLPEGKKYITRGTVTQAHLDEKLNS